MPRWEQKRKADERPSVPRYVQPKEEPKSGKAARRGGGVRNRAPFQWPTLTPAVITTPRGGQRPAPEAQEPAAPPQAAVPPVPKDPRGPGRLDDPIAGKGPKGNEVGSDSDPDEPGLQGPGDPKGAPGARVNANGLVSYGKDLSSLNQFTKEFTGGYELTDIKSAFQSNDLTGAYQNGSNTISTDESKYSLPDGAVPSNVGGKYSMGDGDISVENTGYKINPSSVPGTVGGNPSDPQDGTSDKPDLADNIRAVRMRRKGPRDEGSFRGFQIDQANEMAQNSVSETKGNGMNEKRRAIRSAFLDMDTPIIQASVKANAIAGYGKDSDGNARFNYGGELVYAKDGMQQKAKNAAMMGQDPTQFLDVPSTPDTQPDQPAAAELSPSFAKETPGAQAFFKDALKKVKEENK